jgi:hypothetical protein
MYDFTKEKEYEARVKEVNESRQQLVKFRIGARTTDVSFASLEGNTLEEKFIRLREFVLLVWQLNFDKDARCFLVTSPEILTTCFREEYPLGSSRKFGPHYVGKTVDGLYLYNDPLWPRGLALIGDDSYKTGGTGNFIRISIKDFVL